MKQNILSILYLCLMQSCILFNFVGGQGELERYSINANYNKTLILVDNFIKEHPKEITRRFNGTGYDQGRGRLCYLKEEDISFEIKILGEETGWQGKSNYSEIVILFVSVKGIRIDSGERMSADKKAVYKATALQIEKLFIGPIRARAQS